ncbi:T-complex protein 11-domain-containing protein [Phialemonium atrogriseum]|uniref:T-complex protein 11-domain-containing protein n=1 Tax=Phialemonium atrogriseum TaxID=1093897 RepID=A0AAJ0C8T1_9PEZI|nr:T-complex protein 11-domain-containing protein [Phialemonium atrogriseum]KAK1772269.1 T-complex protein 11-domain-containing protein [Phialemonium atrogriseum]
MPQTDLNELSRNLEEPLDSPSSTIPEPGLDLSMSPPEVSILATTNDDDADPSTTDPEGRAFAPPPRIAASRFYHPTNQSRRKESAASSRRNSISSVQSRSSHGACSLAGAGEPQSKYIAQHLRRASILESRKARLADRAAHAEKVRLRAAMAKAATKDISASEERALAVAMAREKNLAEIAATCAEEVKRAKAVAESMKERREQEIQKLRLQMEERMAEAERRREELRSRNAAKFRGRERGHSLMMSKPSLAEVLPDVEEVKERESSPMRTDVAASKIQWWWRAVKRRQAVAEFSGLGLTVDGVRDTSFEKVTELLAQENVLLITARVLRICGLREGDTGSVNEMAAVRTFLSSFLILGHPAQVLSSKEGKGDQEQVGAAQAQPIPRDDLANPQLQELVGKARDLLISFENVLSHLTSLNNYTPPPALLRSLSEVYATFHNAFIGWKARDSNSLVEVMVMQFVELDAIWQTVKDNTDGSVDEVYRQSIQDNQLKLMVRIKKLAGPQQGKNMVFEAVRKARKARAKKPTGDTKPRMADHSISTEAAMGDLGAQDHHGPSNQTQTPTPPATPSRKDQVVHANVHAGKIQGLLPDNRVVVHELAINKEFRIAADEYREQQEHLLEPLFREMRCTMQTDNQEAHFLLLLEVAKYIREKLQRLVKPGNSMHTFIAELLDTDVAHQQFVTGSFSYEKFFQAMGSLLPKLCAPIRDDEVKELVDTKLSQGNYVDRLEALMGFTDVMLSDYANYLLRLAAPQIIESATPYEAKIFAAGLETGRYDLSAAETAWRAARQKILAEAARRDPEGINHPRSRPTPDRIYSQMLVNLFTQLGPVAEEDVPEMLRLDYKRTIRSGQMTRRIITAGAILLQCKNILKRDVRAPWRTEASRIINVLEAAELHGDQLPETTVDNIMTVLESGRSIPAATKTHLRALVSKLVLAIREAAERREPEPREPVLRLLLSRLRAHVLGRLAAASASEKVRATSTAGEKLASLGLAEFVEKVRDMVDEIAKVGAVDRDAHGLWWETVAGKVEMAEGAAASGSGAEDA